jgi:hypothetical protein
MEINILIASIIFSIILLIIINNIMHDYDIEFREQIKLFMYVWITSITSIYLYKTSIIETFQKDKNQNASRIVLGEMKDTKSINNQLSVPVIPSTRNNIFGGNTNGNNEPSLLLNPIELNL